MSQVSTGRSLYRQRQLAWLTLLLAIGGCDGAATAGNSGSAGAAESPAVAPSPPPSLSAGTLALYADFGDDDRRVRIGDKGRDDAGIFPSPVKNVVPTPLPSGLSPEEFVATGWERGDASQGAGFILNGRTKEIVVAIVRETVESADDAQKLLDEYKHKFSQIDPQTKLIGSYNYTFWDEGENRLMILEAPGKKDTVELTLALGVKSVMTFLRADPTHAQEDATRVNVREATTNHASSAGS